MGKRKCAEYVLISPNLRPNFTWSLLTFANRSQLPRESREPSIHLHLEHRRQCTVRTCRHCRRKSHGKPERRRAFHHIQRQWTSVGQASRRLSMLLRLCMSEELLVLLGHYPCCVTLPMSILQTCKHDSSLALLRKLHRTMHHIVKNFSF